MFKKSALTWKVKDNAASQLARSDARHAVSGVNQGGEGETVLPKGLTGRQQCSLLPKFRHRRDSAGSCIVGSHKGHITFYNFEAVSVKFQFHLYMTSVGSSGADLPYKNIMKNSYLFILNNDTCTHTYILRNV